MTVLSEKFTCLDKSVFIIKWEMNAVLVAVIGFTGVSYLLWILVLSSNAMGFREQST